MNSSRSTRWPIGVLVAVAATVFALLVAEIGWRVYLSAGGHGFADPIDVFNSPFFTTWEPVYPVFETGGFRFRNTWVASEKAPGELRVVCHGGSTTVNQRAGVSFSQLLDERFAESGRPVRVLNAGGEGYSSAHTLVNLSLRTLEADPDVIVVFHNINDLSANWFGAGADPDYANKYLEPFYLGLRHRVGWSAELVKVSRLARYAISRNMAYLFPDAETLSERDYGPGLAYFERNLKSIIAVARHRGIELLLLTQPAASSSDFSRAEGYLAYNQAIRGIGKQEGIEVVDLARVMTDEESFLSDAFHYTRVGVQRLADVLEPVLVRAVENAANRE